MPDDQPVYEIMDGVRRAKAAQISGRQTISALLNGVGTTLVVPISALRSPKDIIETTSIRGLSWGKILRATQNDVALPPIEISIGSSGVLIEDVKIEEDELNVFRNSP